MKFAPLAASACLLAACTTSAPLPSHSPAAAIEAPANPTSLPTATPSPQPAPPTPSHVFLIVMENRSYSQAMSNRYVAQLAARYSYATNYHGVSHPSLPNYLAMTSGTTWGIFDDGFHPLPAAAGLGTQLTAARIPWRAYMEGMTNGCFNSPYPYALKHNPFAYYGSRCPAEVVPFTHFAADMKGNVPRFVWITPNLCNDGHDCSSAIADAWLAHTVGTILASAAWQHNGLLLITWDEGEDSSNSVLTLVIHANPRVHKSSRPYNHYSLLATIEDRLGLARLGQAAKASAMTDLLAG